MSHLSPNPATIHIHNYHGVPDFLHAPSAGVHAGGAGAAPVLYGADNRPIPPGLYGSYQREAAGNAGPLRGWNPRKYLTRDHEARDREKIAGRAIDLMNSEPGAIGLARNMVSMETGYGLSPHPNPDNTLLDLSDDELARLKSEMRRVYRKWAPFASVRRIAGAGFGHIQFERKFTLIKYGESLVLVRMVPSKLTPYRLALQAVNPLRLKTPTDKMRDPRLNDGVEVAENGEIVAYWVKKSGAQYGAGLSDHSSNFMRIPKMTGHRQNVFHFYWNEDPEQFRGVPLITQAVRHMRNMFDYLDSETLSAIVTAAMAVWIETPNPHSATANFPIIQSKGGIEERYQSISAGGVMYGASGQKPHLLSADRPGQSFEPFVNIMSNLIAFVTGYPTQAVYRNFSGLSFSALRGVMSEAWRVVSDARAADAESFCQPIYSMLMEEAYLLGHITAEDYYTHRADITRAEWIGSPKGQIEPLKEIQSTALAIEAGLETRTHALLEKGRDYADVKKQLDEENKDLDTTKRDGPQDGS